MEYMNTEGLEKITVDGVDVYVIIRDDDYKVITYVDRDMYYSIVAEWDIETALEIAKTIKQEENYNEKNKNDNGSDICIDSVDGKLCDSCFIIKCMKVNQMRNLIYM